MLLAVILSLVAIVPAAFADPAEQPSAQESTTPQIQSDDKICYDTDQATQAIQESLIVQPYKLCKGNAGTARIEQQGSNSIWWSVNPGYSIYYNFTGTITITDYATGNYVTEYEAIGDNFFGFTTSGKVSVNLKSGRYTATLTGWCWDTNGEFSWVAPDCDTPFIAGTADFAANVDSTFDFTVE